MKPVGVCNLTDRMRRTLIYLNFLLNILRPELLHFALAHFAFKKLTKLLHFALKVVTIQVNAKFCVESCYILR